MDILLDETSHDIVIQKGDLALVRKDDAIRQNMKQRYLFFFAEWFLDNSKGVPYFQFILLKNPNIDLVEATLRNVAVQTPGILELKSFSMDYDNQNRSVSIELESTSTDGDINLQVAPGV